MRRYVCVGALGVGLLAAVAWAAVSRPAGAPHGLANLGGRVFRTGTTGAGKFLIEATAGDAVDQTIRFQWCFDEGLPTESRNRGASSRVPAGVRTTSALIDIPRGVKGIHWVICFGKVDGGAGDETWTWAVEGTQEL